MLVREPVVGDEPFFVHLADDLIDGADAVPAQMARCMPSAAAACSASKRCRACRDGQVRHRRDGRARGPRQLVKQIVEKPRPRMRRRPRGRRTLPVVADDLRKLEQTGAARAARSSSPTASPTCSRTSRSTRTVRGQALRLRQQARLPAGDRGVRPEARSARREVQRVPDRPRRQAEAAGACASIIKSISHPRLPPPPPPPPVGGGR